MKTFDVTFEQVVQYKVTVQASDSDDAVERAYAEFDARGGQEVGESPLEVRECEEVVAERA